MPEILKWKNNLKRTHKNPVNKLFNSLEKKLGLRSIFSNVFFSGSVRRIFFQTGSLVLISDFMRVESCEAGNLSIVLTNSFTVKILIN